MKFQQLSEVMEHSGNNPSVESLPLCDWQSHGCVVESPVFLSPCMGRMSVIQYWNSETTAVVSSKTQRDRQQNFSYSWDCCWQHNTRGAVSVLTKETYLLLYFQHNKSKSSRQCSNLLPTSLHVDIQVNTTPHPRQNLSFTYSWEVGIHFSESMQSIK